MKRNKELIRSILLRIEECDNPRSSLDNLAELGEKDLTHYHLSLLDDAGLVERKIVSGTFGGTRIDLGWRITWAGHEFLDAVRDPEIWRKTKRGADRLGSWTIKILGEMATALIREKAKELGLPLT